MRHLFYMPVQEPVLGINQHFPQRCMGCDERFLKDDWIAMLPYLVEGKGERRVLWAMWLCVECAPAWEPDEPDTEAEPDEVKLQRLRADREMNRRALATRRRAVQDARRQLAAE